MVNEDKNKQILYLKTYVEKCNWPTCRKYSCVGTIGTVTCHSRDVQVAFTTWVQIFWGVRLCSDWFNENGTYLLLKMKALRSFQTSTMLNCPFFTVESQNTRKFNINAFEISNLENLQSFSSSLMFVPRIAGLCIENQHFALGFVNVFITNAAPTCFGTYVPSTGSVFVLVSTWKLRQLCPGHSCLSFHVLVFYAHFSSSVHTNHHVKARTVSRTAVLLFSFQILTYSGSTTNLRVGMQVVTWIIFPSKYIIFERGLRMLLQARDSNGD
jgi:hypothetical protein